jgi:hypothetical protein
MSQTPGPVMAAPETPAGNIRWPWIWISAAAAGLCLLPIVFPWQPRSSVSGTTIQSFMLYGLPAVVVLLCYRLDTRIIRQEKFQALFLGVMLCSVTNSLHFTIVDGTAHYFGTPSNVDWQKGLHSMVLRLSPGVIPHSYRFLPDGMVRLFEMITGQFESARDTYRNTFGILLFYALYRFGRQHLTHLGALMAMLLWAVCYPISSLHGRRCRAEQRRKRTHPT